MEITKRNHHLLDDKRLTERLLREGSLDAQEQAKRTKALPDLADEVIYIEPYEDQAADAAGLTFEAGEAGTKGS